MNSPIRKSKIYKPKNDLPNIEAKNMRNNATLKIITLFSK
tara:strand:- start:158 stop:277 length:120 start_codon:yes stop_codon:yes gene_type:complete